MTWNPSAEKSTVPKWPGPREGLSRARTQICTQTRTLCSIAMVGMKRIEKGADALGVA